MAETPTPHLLVVDDHREIREALRDYLARNGYRVSVATGTSEARDILSRFAVDLIVLDIMMPGEDGMSFYRSLGEGSRIPVIFLTAVAEEADRILGLELGADDYLVKPFNPRELLARIRAVLRRWHSLPPERVAATASRYRFDGFVLDTERRALNGPEGPVALSTGEYRLLLALVTHAGMTLTRDQLLDITRGRDARAFDRSVDVQVSRLRRKIEPDPTEPRLIRTQRGGGYALGVKVDPE